MEQFSLSLCLYLSLPLSLSLPLPLSRSSAAVLELCKREEEVRPRATKLGRWARERPRSPAIRQIEPLPELGYEISSKLINTHLDWIN